MDLAYEMAESLARDYDALAGQATYPDTMRYANGANDVRKMLRKMSDFLPEIADDELARLLDSETTA
jgi:hypothetical protein